MCKVCRMQNLIFLSNIAEIISMSHLIQHYLHPRNWVKTSALMALCEALWREYTGDIHMSTSPRRWPVMWKTFSWYEVSWNMHVSSTVICQNGAHGLSRSKPASHHFVEYAYWCSHKLNPQDFPWQNNEEGHVTDDFGVMPRVNQAWCRP